ncbi:hypothetical protein J4U02_gp093 [Mycobacterium phage Aziz]|uniref:Uncharacterized protein n=1 Tax=Mycobacterium phage Aziz TaxID=2762281 RepID=A0A7G8LHN1_9CAUD|nr:hypothetical protein J4U02_gp093 [Mycobacterium phage Aziz]ASR75941.1 hypothetical protein SEA_GENEVAB15_95 [Mycobacterium phage GenevaB15]QNJ56753.1 hypothetical protein SEA_AZIZ_93 [Mycobacterium phage Aziz]
MRFRRRKSRRRIDWDGVLDDLIEIFTFAWVFTLLDNLLD